MTAVLLFSGGLTRLDEAGQSTGIYKQPVTAPVRLGLDGLRGDLQADRRVHGGPEKAIHHYPAEHYPRLAKAFPTVAEQLVPGSIGENVSTHGFEEATVCIGDIFRLGRARLQVSQPRSPCWKIDHRYGHDGLARTIAERGLTGWYYRVLAVATVSTDDELELIERLPDAVPLAELLQVWRQHRPEPARLRQLSAAPGLTAGWQKKLLDRLHWLQADATRSRRLPTPEDQKQGAAD